VEEGRRTEMKARRREEGRGRGGGGERGGALVPAKDARAPHPPYPSSPDINQPDPSHAHTHTQSPVHSLLQESKGKQPARKRQHPLPTPRPSLSPSFGDASRTDSVPKATAEPRRSTRPQEVPPRGRPAPLCERERETERATAGGPLGLLSLLSLASDRGAVIRAPPRGPPRTSSHPSSRARPSVGRADAPGASALRSNPLGPRDRARADG
jgi:hypothetical protein